MTNKYSSIKQNQYIRSLVYHFRWWREIHSYCLGKGNKVEFKGIRVKSLIQVSGYNNTVLVMHQAVLKKAKIFVKGNNNKVIVNSWANLQGTELLIEDNDCTIEIGEHTFIGPSHIACTEDGNSILIGKNCILSSNINIRTGDSHSILDLDGNRINQGQSVFIDDHVWIGEGAKILKGVKLQKDTIVATGSIVTHSFPSNIIVAGNPAKCIKEGVNWDSRRF